MCSAHQNRYRIFHPREQLGLFVYVSSVLRSLLSAFCIANCTFICLCKYRNYRVSSFSETIKNEQRSGIVMQLSVFVSQLSKIALWVGNKMKRVPLMTFSIIIFCSFHLTWARATGEVVKRSGNLTRSVDSWKPIPKTTWKLERATSS